VKDRSHSPFGNNLLGVEKSRHGGKMAVSTIFFDYGGTLVKVPPIIARPEKVWVEAAWKLGLNLSETLVRHALEATNERMEGQIYRYVGRTAEYWTLFDVAVMDRLHIREKREELGNAVDGRFADPTNRELFPEARTILEQLKDSGYHLGLISNNNDFLLKVLAYHGLDKLLDSVTYSQEVGAEKPAPQIFSKALERAHCAPAEAVHVGGSLHADVEGAQRSGMHAIWLNRTDEPGSTNCLTIRTLYELPAVLQLIGHIADSPR